MAAILTASVNPVGVWGSSATGETTITWDTGSAAPGRLYLQTAFTPAPPPAVLFDGDPASGDIQGKKLLTVAVGPTYTLILRQVSDNSVLATLQVMADDLAQDYINRAAQEAQFEGLAVGQLISNVAVQAGADDARVTFKTNQPTIPIVTATAPDGSVAGLCFPVLNGMQTEHDVRLGVSRPLAQQTSYTLTITAAGTNFAGHSITRIAKSRFTTGRRDATVNFEMVQILNGTGEFSFQFGAGDADQVTDLGEPWPTYRNDFGDSDPPHWIRYAITIPNAPRHLWVGATGAQYSHPLNGGLGTLGTKPDFDGPLTGYAHSGDTSVAWANAVYDIGNGGTPVVGLTTGFFDIMFEVRGQIVAFVTPGTMPKLPKLEGSRSKSGLRLLSGGAKATLQGPRGKALTVTRGADGAIYARAERIDRRLAPDEGWVALSPPIERAVTVVGNGEDRIACFALDAEGAVLRADAAAGHPAREWQRLGGHFAGAVAAVSAGGAIVLLAQDREGTIFERRVPERGPAEAGDDWRPVGAARLGTVALRALHDGDFAVFALDCEGRATYRRRDRWHAIPGATGVTLGVSEIARDAVGLVLIDDAGRLHSLVWRHFEEREPGKWTAEGDFQQWLVRPLDGQAAGEARASAAE